MLESVPIYPGSGLGRGCSASGYSVSLLDRLCLRLSAVLAVSVGPSRPLIHQFGSRLFRCSCSPARVFSRLFTHHAVAVRVAHVLVGGVPAVYWRDPVSPGFRARDPAVAVAVVHG